MRILVVNDDGYTAYGIRKLAKELAKEHEVTVVAPIKCNSGMAHAMTFYKPYYLKAVETNEDENFKCYHITGTPSDCVKIGTELMHDNLPDLVISGINTEPNIGSSVIYSGTAHAAMEASVLGIKSFAVSSNCENEAEYDYVIDYIIRNLDYYFSLCSGEYALNININNPKIGNKEHKITPLGIRMYSDFFLIGDEDENGTPYSLLGDPLLIDNAPDCDVVWFEKGYATITPLMTDHTYYSKIDELKEKK